MTFSIHTFGCKVNIYESEYLINIMQNAGYQYQELNNQNISDIYIVNTCTVTNEADKKDRKMINHLRTNYPNAILIVCGCYSQLNPNKINADIVIGNKYKSLIPELINEYLKNKKQIIKVEDISETNFEDMYINRFINHTRAFVKIQDGCNAFCAYCTIPYARGGLRSKNFQTVINEVTELVSNGYGEIILTGIHTGRYGLEQHTSLERLLTELVKIPGLFRIRLSSIEINEITNGIIKLIKETPIMAKHLHIPLQSGSDTILSSMNRQYNMEYFHKRIAYIREEIPSISITTDLIVGFPSEKDELFQETIVNLNKLKFTKIHTFPYSKRDGTVAATMKNQIPNDIKKCRVHEVLHLSNTFETAYYQKCLNQEYDGIIETRKDNKKIVITSNYIPVEVITDLPNNSQVKIKITKVDNLKITGEII